ncbi:MAG: ABC transporter permease [Anaerolineae bacterium]|nr:MAG: ABC transporter permease [Anaerolineae bacterium]
MRILDIALKDLVQIFRDKKSLLFLILIPIAFTLFMGFAFRNSDKDPRLPVGWVNHDRRGALGTQLRDLVEATETIDLVPLEGDKAAEADQQVRDEELAAAVIVPEGFSAQALAGAPLPLTIVVPNTTAGQTATTALQAATKRLLGAVKAARLSVEVLGARSPFADETTRQATLETSLAQASAAWQQPTLTVALAPATGARTDAAETPGGFLQSSPGMMVQFAVFSLITSAMVLVLERKSGALRRLLTAPLHRAEIMAGHLLAMFVIVFLQSLLLVALGQLAFGVDYLREPLGTLLMMVALGLWVTSLGLLIGALARGEEQVVIFSLIAMFVFAALGGAWFPLEIAGKAFARVGHVMPTAWAMDGFQDIIVRGLGLESVLLSAGLLLAYAAAFFGLAIWRFRFG